MRNLSLIFFLSLLSIISFAQKDYFTPTSTAIYKISTEEAKHLLTKNKHKGEYIEQQLLHTLVDTFYKNYTKKDELSGCYLFVEAKNQTVQAELRTFNDYDVEIDEDDKMLIVQLLNKFGKVVTNATVEVDGKKIPYHAVTQTFRTKRKRKGLLFVEIGDEILIGEVRRYSRWYRFWEGVSERSYYFSKRIRPHKKRLDPYSWKYTIEKPGNGYIVTSQPRYNLLDTVKVKAYITTKKGKPLKKDIEYVIFDEEIGWNSELKRDGIASGILKPNTKGNYTFDFLLSDTLTLDKDYFIYLTDKRNKRRPKVYFEQDFYLEDYELNQIDFDLDSKKRYEYGEKIIISAAGTDKNGHFIPDGTIKLTASVASVNTLYKDEISVKKIIWETEQPLDVDDYTQILIPWDSIPEADISLRVETRISNSNGVYRDMNTFFSVNKQRERVSISYDENNTIHAQYFKDNTEIPYNGKFKIYRDFGKDTIVEKEVKLPFKMKYIPAEGDYFSIKTDKDFAFMTTAFTKSLVKWNSSFRNDSVFLQLNNPRGLLVEYKVFELNKLIVTDTTSNRQFIFEGKNKKNKTFTVKYQYVWLSKRNVMEKAFTDNTRQLNITIDQPKTIKPGDRLTVKLNVTDQKNQPVPNVNLTAFAINSAFNNEKHYRLPRLTKPLHKYEMPTFYYRYSNDIQTTSLLNYEKNWPLSLDLQKSLYYRVRFPENGMLMEYNDVSEIDTFYKNIAQFAPYIVKDGHRQTAHLIYLDQELIYYSNATKSRPYAFIASEGYHDIIIRTSDYIYYIDSVLIKKGYKLELSIDELRYANHPHGKYVRRMAVENKLTDFERRTIRRNTLHLSQLEQNKYSEIYFKQSNLNIQRMPKTKYYTYNYTLFPFKANEFVDMLASDTWEKEFRVKSGYQHQLFYDRIELTEYEDFLEKSPDLDFVYHDWAIEQAGGLVYTPSDIKKKVNPIWEKLAYFQKRKKDTDAYNPYDGNADFTIMNRNDFNQDWYIVWFRNGKLIDITGIYYVFRKKAGDYDLLFFNKDGTHFYKKARLKADYNYCMRIDEKNTTYLTDTNLQFFMSLIDGSYLENKDFITISNDQPLTTAIQAFGDSAIFSVDIHAYLFNEDERDGYALFRPAGKSDIIKKVWLKGNFNFKTNLAPGVYDIDFYIKNAKSKHYSSVFVKANQILGIDFITERQLRIRGIAAQESEVRIVGSRKKKYKESAILTPRYFYSTGKKEEKVRGGAFGFGSKTSSFDVDDIDNFYLENDKTYRRNYERGQSMNYLTDTDGTPDTVYEMVANNTSMFSATNSIRTNFKDLAYWQPNLITDQNGEAYFTIRFPENITSWKTTVIGMDDKLRSGFTQMNTQSFKPVMAQLVVPRFLIKGDRAEVIGKSINYTADSFEINTQFETGYRFLKNNGSVLKSSISSLKNAVIEKVEVSPITVTDSFLVKYQLQMDDYLDGEERVIPVFQKGVTETEGFFYILEGDTTISFPFEKDNQKEVYLTATSNTLDWLLQDIEYLKDYPYGCNEQNASRLTALLLEEKIKLSLNEPFQHKGKILRTIRQLAKAQNEDGSWGWWKNGKGNDWMTIYVVTALSKARQSGYKVDDLMTKGTGYLINNDASLPENRYKYLAFFNMITNAYPNAKKEFTDFDTTNMSLHDQMLWIKILQFYNRPYSLEMIDAQMKRTTTGGIYFGEYNYNWTDNSIQLCLLAHEIYKKAGREDVCRGIRQYFLEKRQHNGWRNTFESAQILDLILPYLLKNGQKVTANELIVGDNRTKLDGQPFETSFNENLKSKPSQITKTGSTPVYLTIYTKEQNENPTVKSDIFKVNTTFHQKGNTLKDNITLEKNERITLKARVEIKEAADYVMIEVPIPAGCTYASKPQNGGVEVHREYFKNKVSIFCEHLPIGTYEFSIPLEARFSGAFTVNAAKVEQMYFPVFYGRNENKVVKVE